MIQLQQVMSLFYYDTNTYCEEIKVEITFTKLNNTIIIVDGDNSYLFDLGEELNLFINDQYSYYDIEDISEEGYSLFSETNVVKKYLEFKNKQQNYIFNTLKLSAEEIKILDQNKQRGKIANLKGQKRAESREARLIKRKS